MKQLKILISMLITAILLVLTIPVNALTVKQVTASNFDDKGGHKPQYVVDGSNKTRWAAQGNATWINIEFDRAEQLKNFVIVPFKANERSLNFTISYSINGKNWVDINNQYQTSLLESKSGEKFIFSKPIKAKFFRLNTLGTNVNKWSAILELTFNSDEAIPSQSIQ